MTLHIVSQSPFQNSALDSCLGLAAVNDVIVLINDGVYALQQPVQALTQAMERNSVFALQDDLLARGLAFPANVAIDYPQFVALTCKHNPIQSWY